MGIQKDAGELLVYCYEEQLKGNSTDSSEFKSVSGWDITRALNAVRYLSDKGLIQGQISDQGYFFVSRLLPQGIDIIENKNEFKNTFGFTVNLGVVSFSWGTKKE